MATESFALHNLGSDMLLVIRDTHCCHATMVNVKGPFASVTPQKAGVAYGAPNLPRTPRGPHYFWKKEKEIFPLFFPLQEDIILDFKEQRRAQPWGPHVVTVPGLQHLAREEPSPPTPWGCRGQDLALAISLVQSTAVHKTLIYNFWGLLAASRPETPPHNQARYCEVSGSSS